MDKKEAFDLLREMLDKFGQTAEHAWPLVIRSYYAQSLSNIIYNSLILLATIIVFSVLTNLIFKTKFKERENKFLSFGGVMFIFVITAPIFFAGIMSNLPGLIEPEGGFIRTLIGM